MANYWKRKGARGVAWTARVRYKGVTDIQTFKSKTAAEAWARARETAIDTGVFTAPDGKGLVFADLVDRFREHRRDTRKAPGVTFDHTLTRLKAEHGLVPAAALATEFWHRHALARIRGGVESQTASSELAYAGSVLAHAKRQKLIADASGPAQARLLLKDEGFRVTSRTRERRITDNELERLLAACDTINTGIPLRAIVEFALATAMRRGEILHLLRADVNAETRVAIVRNRKHPHDRDRIDEVPLMPKHREWPRWDALEIIKSQTQKKGDDRVFPCLGDSVAWAFEQACKEAKLSGVVFHLLRHEALSRYAERKLDVLRLQLIGGHRDLRHLMRYAKLSAAGLAAEGAAKPARRRKAA